MLHVLFFKVELIRLQFRNGLIDKSQKKLNKVSNNYMKSATLSKSLPIIALSPLTKIGLSIRIDKS
jgi:hypothetical protein